MDENWDVHDHFKGRERGLQWSRAARTSTSWRAFVLITVSHLLMTSLTPSSQWQLNSMRRGRQRCQQYFANRGYFISESFELDLLDQIKDYTANRTLKRTGLEKNSQHYLLSKVMRTNVTKVTKLWHLMTVWKFKVLRIRYEHYWSEFNHGWPHSTADDRNWPPVISSNGSERVKNCQFR